MTAYSRYCEGRSLFIATRSPKPTGHIVKFKVALASGEHLITGVGPVVETFNDRDNRFNRPGMRVEVEKLDASGRHWMEQLRTRTGAAGSDGGAPAVASAPTGMFATISDESTATAAAPPPAAAPPAPIAEPGKQESAVPVAVADNLSAGWELDGLSAEALAPLKRPRPQARASGKPGDRPASNGTPAPKEVEKPTEAVVASGELDIPPPLPPPPSPPRGGRSKRITFPALMFNKPRGLATPPTGAVVPKPIASTGKGRPPTAPVAATSPMAALAPAVPTSPVAALPPAPAPPAPIEREPGAPVAPLGTPADTEPHVMVPPEIESSLARAHPPATEPPPSAEGTPPPAAEPSAPIAAADDHPEITDAPPEGSGPVATGKRSKASNTTPPPVWGSVTQTFDARVGGKPDPRLKEEAVHWTNPTFAALSRPPTPPVVDIIEEVPPGPQAAVPVVVGVEITADVMDRTVVSPPPAAATRLRLLAAVAVTAVAGLSIGYVLGLSRGTPLEKLPVGEVAAAAASPPVPGGLAWGGQCADPARTEELTAAPEPEVEPPTAAARTRPPEPRAAQSAPPPPSSSSSSSSCYLNATTSPAGATVLIDNKVSGRTPLRTRLSCGQHSVKFEMVNFQAATRTFSVRRGETEKV
ncbi:MAG TPA: PEGA domain-containing protein, partial [Kofleriaceae bacterium]|nr:PEGA domain-containing protein [Kofleriaceae bacterium]